MIDRVSRSEGWTAEHFSLSNPKDGEMSDVPALLRRLAAAIEALGTIEVLDITFHAEVHEGEDWPSMTVYFHRNTESS